MRGLVSVVVPCFNYGRFLEDCVQSLAQQSYRNWECVIVDDGSTDETPQVSPRLSALDPRVRFVRQENRGLSAARNAGIREARGEFLQFLDADDLLEAHKLRTQVDFLWRHPEVDIVAGPALFFISASRSRHRLTTAGSIDVANEAPEHLLAALVEENFIPVNAVLVRRSALDMEEPFDPSLPAREDWDLWLRCALRGRRFAFVSAGGDAALIRHHVANMSAARQLMLRTSIVVRQRVHASLPERLKGRNAARLAEARWRLGLDLMRAGKLKVGWRCYREGFHGARHRYLGLLLLPLAMPGVTALLSRARRLYRSLR